MDEAVGVGAVGLLPDGVDRVGGKERQEIETLVAGAVEAPGPQIGSLTGEVVADTAFLVSIGVEL